MDFSKVDVRKFQTPDLASIKMRNWNKSTEFDFTKIKCVVFDFGFTLSSESYFNVFPLEFPLWQDIIQQKFFSDPALVDEWMSGKISLRDIAELLSIEINLETSEIVEFMKKGCENLEFNLAVLDFAISVRDKGVKTAIVTGNMDVFTNVVVPWHQLDEKFDIILNSFDYQELDKAVLWPIAFKLLGSGIEYGNSLLVEDGSQNVEKFRNFGGYAYKYSNDQEFLMWQDEINIKTELKVKSSQKDGKTHLHNCTCRGCVESEAARSFVQLNKAA